MQVLAKPCLNILGFSQLASRFGPRGTKEGESFLDCGLAAPGKRTSRQEGETRRGGEGTFFCSTLFLKAR